MQFIHVSGKGIATGQMARAQRMILKICFQVGAAVFAGQYVLQSENECTVVAFICSGGMHGVIEAHGVQIVPQGRTPYRGQKPVTRQKILICKHGFLSSYNYF